MTISSRTPEGEPNFCPVCGNGTRTDPSTVPTPDAPCPHCGILLWFGDNLRHSVASFRQLIRRLTNEVVELSEARLPPCEYYTQFLQRVVTAMTPIGGAVWLWKEPGIIELQVRCNLEQVGLDRPEVRRHNDELLRQAFTAGRAMLISPGVGAGIPDPRAAVTAAMLPDYAVLLAPIRVNGQVAGLVEIWQDAARPPDTFRGMLRFMKHMAGLAAGYVKTAEVSSVETPKRWWKPW
jgi:hypothetical protein